MGFLQRIFGSKREELSEPNVHEGWMADDAWRKWEPPLNIVRGESYRQNNLVSLAGKPCKEGYLIPVQVVFIREPANEYDKNAIRAEVRGIHVGYMAKEVAAALSPALDRAHCSSFSVAGIIRGGSEKAKSFGCHVWIERRLTPGPLIRFTPEIEKEFRTNWPPSDTEGATR